MCVGLRELAGRDLDASLARDAAGDVRLVWPSPSWEDVLDLAFAEIRLYGAGSIQICRRLRAVLDDLLASTPAERHPAIEAQLLRLDAAVLSAFPDGSPEQATAMAADPTGLGLARGRFTRFG